MEDVNLKKTLSLLVGGVCKNGDRILAEQVVNKVLFRLKKVYGTKATPVFLRKVVRNLLPKIRLRNQRKGGVVYKVPTYLSKSDALLFAVRWFRQAVLNRKERSLEDRIFREFVDVYGKRGESFKKKKGVHSTALLNRGFRYSRS